MVEAMNWGPEFLCRATRLKIAQYSCLYVHWNFLKIQPFLGLLAESMVKFLRLQSASAIMIHVGVFIHFNVTFMWIERAEFSHQIKCASICFSRPLLDLI
jgi:hypothetical protein